MSKIRALIVDDEPLARERIRALLADENGVEIIGECADGRSAVSLIKTESPDLLFLDVQMPEMSGFEVLEKIGAQHVPSIIFVTAYDQYALRAFDVHALDYLLKPFDRERFQTALERARTEIERARGGHLQERLLSLLADLKVEQKYLERLVIKDAGRVFFLRTEEIDWIESAGNYARLHVGSASHLLRETMNTLESRLSPTKFLRIHRTTIINVERIKEMHPMFRGEYVLVLSDGTRLTSGRAYKDKLQELLGNSF
ncbi:MAG: LytTR family DNA-binding domain-containing protein [Pyrinomonadaceae bacterium]